MTGADAILRDVVEEHLDEAEFLLESWLAAARSPLVTLAALQKTIERRLVAHLDALVIGGKVVADDLLWPTVGEGAEVPVLRVAAAALALLSDPDARGRDELIDRLRGAKSDPIRGGIARAFELTTRSDVDEPLRLALYASETPEAQAILLAVLAARRIDPGPILGPLLQSANPGVVAAALRAAAASDPRMHQQTVDIHLSHEVPEIRAAALRTALIWNSASAWRTCVADARAGSPVAFLYLALLGGPGELRVLTAALDNPDLRAGALWALGFSGRGEAVDTCLALLDDSDQKVAKLAAEAVAAITDLPADEEPFTRKPAPEPGDAELPPLEEDLTVDLAPDPADDLPLVDAARVRAWWSERRPSYQAGRRYLRGKPISAALVEGALIEGSLRRSGPLALEIAVQSGARLQLPALRLAYAKPSVPAEIPLHKQPVWR